MTALFLFGLACNENSLADKNLNIEEPLPNFSLTDLNPNSASYMMAVSPRDYLDEGSVWYFGHAT